MAITTKSAETERATETNQKGPSWQFSLRLLFHLLILSIFYCFHFSLFFPYIACAYLVWCFIYIFFSLLLSMCFHSVPFSIIGVFAHSHLISNLLLPFLLDWYATPGRSHRIGKIWNGFVFKIAPHWRQTKIMLLIGCLCLIIALAKYLMNLWTDFIDLWK